MVRAGCPSHNCGGRCLLKVYVRDGVIVRIETDDRPGDTLADPQLRACVRGRAYRKRQYHSDRLMFPLKRVGKRGEGKFARVSWDEALDRVAAEFARIKKSYGNQAFYVPYGTGSYNQINGRQTAQRLMNLYGGLMNLYGGSLGFYNSYSWAAISAATPTVYGTSVTGNQRQDWLNSKYILMWSWNPAEMRDGTNSEYFVRKAREKGARVVCVDPRMTLSAVALADEWVPIRPGTDAAMMSAMAYVMVTEGLFDAAFVRTHCVGFDASQMPPGAEGAESYKDYLLGTRDGVAKTPESPSAASPGPPSPAWPASTRPSSPASSTRATACSGAPTASRPSGPAASWRPSPGTSASPAAGPAASPSRRPTAAPTGWSSPSATTPSRPSSRASCGPRPSCGAARWARPTASAASTSSIRTSRPSGPWPATPSSTSTATSTARPAFSPTSPRSSSSSSRTTS
ncbi:MAG: molybdopterin-dependent oxidoreductase [Acidobacteria bacterium]|nr:molybdopterin-dependent oxidoreductase [Acidobacteriota bacterium]